MKNSWAATGFRSMRCLSSATSVSLATDLRLCGIKGLGVAELCRNSPGYSGSNHLRMAALRRAGWRSDWPGLVAARRRRPRGGESLRSISYILGDGVVVIGFNRSPAWMTRGIAAAINSLQFSAAMWQFSTCCKNPCADIGLTRQRCRAPLSCLTPPRDFLTRGARNSSARAPRKTRAIPRRTRHQVRHEFCRCSLGSWIPFRAKMG